MWEATAGVVHLQCGMEYNKSYIRTTVLSALDSKDSERFPTNYLISERERDFFELDCLTKVAESRNHQFKAKGIRNIIHLSNLGENWPP